MDFSMTDNEVKSVIEINLDNFLSLILRKNEASSDCQVILDRITRKAFYQPHILLSSQQIIPDYFTDKSILEKLLSLKSIID